MSLAWALIKSNKSKVDNLSDALRLAWRAIKARVAMTQEPVLVTFRKANDEIAVRLAAPFRGVVKGTGKSNPLTVLYWSVTKDKIGSFRADRLIKYKPISSI